MQRNRATAAQNPAATRGEEATGAPAASAKKPVVRYVGFRATPQGREYTMSVSDAASSRDFVLFISHQAFATHETRFQDAPDVCSAKLRRELDADPTLSPDGGLVVTSEDMLDYRQHHLTPLEKRARAKT
jgi:hypothetical protein